MNTPMNASTNMQISNASVPELNRLFRLQWEPAQKSHVLLYPEGMVKLNGSAAEILQLVDGERDVDQITQALMEKFPEAGDLSADIVEFLEVAREQNWIRYS